LEPEKESDVWKVGKVKGRYPPEKRYDIKLIGADAPNPEGSTKTLYLEKEQV